MKPAITKIAAKMGAEVVGVLPGRGDGVFGALMLPNWIDELKAELRPGRGARPGRPTKPDWSQHPKVPMSRQTLQRLQSLSRKASVKGRKVSPMQVAATILEMAVIEAGV
jgi:hypothetical protein